MGLIEHRVLAAIMGAVLDEVVGPDMVGMLGPQADAGAIGQPQPSAFGLLGRHLQPFATPARLDPAVADRPAGLSEQRGDLAIAVTTVLTGELDDIGRQPFLGERLYRKLQRAPARRAAQRRNLLHASRSPDRHRELATELQRDPSSRITRLQTTRTGGLRASFRRLAGFAPSSGSAGRADPSARP